MPEERKTQLSEVMMKEMDALKEVVPEGIQKQIESKTISQTDLVKFCLQSL